MKKSLLISLFAIALIISAAGISLSSEIRQDFSPKPEEQQLPQAMHSAMKELPSITVAKVILDGNKTEAKTRIDDRRVSKSK